MSSGVFLLNKDGSLEEMNQQNYSSEEYLQALIEKYPNLLAGQQIDEAIPRKWIVISREFPVPGDDFSGGRWSLDHLLLDQTENVASRTWLSEVRALSHQCSARRPLS